jgi:23S rRNA (adenine2030-N6)-methyltransferase
LSPDPRGGGLSPSRGGGLPARREYAHRDKVGNAGDVWKHVAWLAIVDALVEGPRPLHVIDTHAGEGIYRLGPTGEWTQGIARLRSWFGPKTAGVARYLAAIDPGTYPGSPALLASRLRARDRATVIERHPVAVEALRGVLSADPRFAVVEGDGWDVLPRALGDGDEDTTVLIDPPYVDEADWDRAAEVVASLKGRARVVLWYPVLGPWDRLVRRLVSEGGLALELFHRDPDQPGRGLAGSGLVLFDPPPAALAEAAAAATVLGPALATGSWSFRIRG